MKWSAQQSHLRYPGRLRNHWLVLHKILLESLSELGIISRIGGLNLAAIFHMRMFKTGVEIEDDEGQNVTAMAFSNGGHFS